MAATQSSQPDEAPCPSYRELQYNGEQVFFSAAAKRLYWRLEGVFPSNISVMKTPRDAGDLEPFLRLDAGDSGPGAWHEISSLPVTTPKVSSIEASLLDLDQWESDWVEWHEDHTAPNYNPEYVTYGDLGDDVRPYASEPDEDGDWEEDSDTEFLARCCGEDRPLRKRGIKLKVLPSAGNTFVTIHDYVRAVHPWLMGLRADIFKAKTVARPQPYPLKAATKMEWMVESANGPQHEISPRDLWMESHHPPRPIDATTARFLQRIGARMAH